jgi:hypothetical protein
VTHKRKYYVHSLRSVVAKPEGKKPFGKEENDIVLIIMVLALFQDAFD